MKIVNLTPHEIVIMDENKEIVKRVPISGRIASTEVSRVLYKVIGKIPLFKIDYGFDDPILVFGDEILDFPEAKSGVIYIVSSVLRSGIPRQDLWSPGELVRDKNGDVIGCIGLTQ